MAKQATLGSAVIFLTADVQGLNKRLGDAKKQFQKSFGNIASLAQGLGTKLAAVGAAFGGALAVGVHKVEELGSAIHDLSQKTGASTELLSSLKQGAEESGSGIDAVATSFKNLQKAIVAGSAADEQADGKSLDRKQKLSEQLEDLRDEMTRAQRDYSLALREPAGKGFAAYDKKTNDLSDRRDAMRKQSRELRDLQKELAEEGVGGADGFAMIGLDRNSLVGLKPDEQYLKVARALAEVKDKTLQVAAAQKLWGKNGADLLPMLEGGAKSLDEMRAQAKELGLIWSKEDADAADGFGDSITRLKGGFIGLLKSALVPLLPQLQRFVEWTTQAIVSVRRWSEKNPELTQKILKWGAALAGIATAAGGLLLLMPGLVAMGSVFMALKVPIVAVGIALGLGIASWKDKFSDFREWGLSFFSGIELTFRGGWKRFGKGLLIDAQITFQLLMKELDGFLDSMIQKLLAWGKSHPKIIAYMSVISPPFRNMLTELLWASKSKGFDDTRLQELWADKAALDKEKLEAIGGKTLVEKIADWWGELTGKKKLPEWHLKWNNYNPYINGPLAGVPGHPATPRDERSMRHLWSDLADATYGVQRRRTDNPRDLHGNWHAMAFQRHVYAPKIDKLGLPEPLPGDVKRQQEDRMAGVIGKSTATELAKLLKPAGGLFMLGKAATEYGNMTGRV